MQQYSFDVVIVGGGIVGLSLALALAQRTTLQIGVIDTKIPRYWQATDEIGRVSSISLASTEWFKKLDLWSHICAKRLGLFKAIKVWDQNTRIDFDAQEIAASYLGHIIENDVIHTALLEKISAERQIQWLAPVKLVSYVSACGHPERGEGTKVEILRCAQNDKYSAQNDKYSAQDNSHVELKDEQGNTYRAKLAIAADGARSWLRNQAHIEVSKNDYQQSAIVTTVQTELTHDDIARQVFLASGPLAFLPLAKENECSIVWTLDTESAATCMQDDEEQFRLKLNKAFNFLGKILHAQPRNCFGLQQQQARQYIGERLALVGDALRTVHPLAGLGLNLGLADAANLAKIICDAYENRQDIGSRRLLRIYERERKAETLLITNSIHALQKLFPAAHPWANHARSLGTTFTSKTQWLKNIFMRQATYKIF